MDHIESQRLWAYVREQDELVVDEHLHLSDCERCLQVFRLSVLCQDFEHLQREIGDQFGNTWQKAI